MGPKKHQSTAHCDEDVFITVAEHKQLMESQEKKFQELIALQEKNFKGFLDSYMIATNKRLDDYMRETTVKITELKTSVEFSQQEVDTLQSAIKSTKTTVAKSAADIQFNKEGIDYLENQSRRNNLRLDGITEDRNETWAQTEDKVRDTLIQKLQMEQAEVTALEIERAHRTGPRKEGKPRTVVVRLSRFKDRENILRKVREVKPRGLFINEDFSQAVQDRRRQLVTKMKEHRAQGKIAYLSFDKLIVKDKPSSSS